MATQEKFNDNIKDPLLWNPKNTIKGDSRSIEPDEFNALNNYNTLSYPENIGSERYPFFMMIYVNASTKSKLLSTGSAETVDIDTTQRKVNNSITSSTRGGIKQIDTQAVSDSVDSAGNKIESSKINAVTKVAADVIKDVAKNLSFEPVKKRLKTAVALPMPNELSFMSGVQYTSASGGGLLGSLFQAGANGDGRQAVKAGAETVIQSAGGVITGAAKEGLSLIGDSGSDNKLFDIMMKARGLAINDRREQLFHSVQDRTFSFSWTFFPRSHAESETIFNLIKFLRFHQHPEIDTASGGMNFIIPDEFDIEFHHYILKEIGDDKNLGLPKITTCVLTNVVHNTTPLGEFIAFDGTSHPVGINLQLQFTELEPLTRREIGMGY